MYTFLTSETFDFKKWTSNSSFKTFNLNIPTFSSIFNFEHSNTSDLNIIKKTILKSKPISQSIFYEGIWQSNHWLRHCLVQACHIEGDPNRSSRTVTTSCSSAMNSIHTGVLCSFLSEFSLKKVAVRRKNCFEFTQTKRSPAPFGADTDTKNVGRPARLRGPSDMCRAVRLKKVWPGPRGNGPTPVPLAAHETHQVQTPLHAIPAFRRRSDGRKFSGRRG